MGKVVSWQGCSPMEWNIYYQANPQIFKEKYWERRLYVTLSLSYCSCHPSLVVVLGNLSLLGLAHAGGTLNQR